MNPFPPAKLSALLEQLEKRRPKGRAFAAFDADGTLWNTDLGEMLFDHQIRHKLVPLPEDAWAHYHWLKKNVSNPVAYLWLAQINKGVKLDKVREWAEAAVKEAEPIPVFDEILKIFEKLKSLEVEIRIVTASITWAVEPGARRLGLKNEQVLGIETEVVDGVVTEKQHGVITYREGKAQAFLAHTGGLAPYFAAGNTEGDKWLLECSSDLRLVMSASPADSENGKTEAVMLKLANERGWHHHRYI
jgi:phosphoserine phosphatase